MDPKTLRQLCLQLCRWAEETIRHGRSPFRRVESFPSLLTAEGEMAPPLVVWVNRDSFMAGGVIFFPSREAAEDLASGVFCAQALGLRHFSTWTPRAITFWEDAGEEIRSIRSLPLPAANSLESFRDTFTGVLDQFKLLSVVGAVDAAKLSPFCLANLCRDARREALPALTEAIRVARGESRKGGSHSPAEMALRQGTLVLLRLLALLLLDRLPSAIQPEGLERAMRFALDGLPAEMAAALAETADEIPLPPESAIRFHHLLRRLLQLRFTGDWARAARVLEILLEHEGGILGGFPLDPAIPLAEGGILLNPDCLVPASGGVEVAPAPILGFTSLLRHLRGLPIPHKQTTDLLALTELPAADSIRGELPASGPPPSHLRRALAVRLRLSWPHRRFILHPGTPRWIWEFLHLLGMAAPSARLQLVTPDAWLTAPFGQPLMEVLREQFTLEEIVRLSADRVRLRLRKEDQPTATTLLENPAVRREMVWSRLREGPTSRLVLALDLPESVHALLENGLLLLPERDSPPEIERGIYFFSRSSLGRFLWQIVSGGRPLPARGNLVHLLQHGMPLPTAKVLHHLQHLFLPGDREPTASALDAELSPWFGELSLTVPASRPPRHPSRRRRGLRGETLQALLKSVGSDGLPLFPEHYLYAHYRPELQEYRFTAPLTAGEEFFDRTVLRDRLGAEIRVEGQETARALHLASFGPPRPIALPVDRRLTAAILDRYLDDLRRIRDGLVREAHRRLAEPTSAERLIEEAWGALALPPWPLVDG